MVYKKYFIFDGVRWTGVIVNSLHCVHPQVSFRRYFFCGSKGMKSFEQLPGSIFENKHDYVWFFNKMAMVDRNDELSKLN